MSELCEFCEKFREENENFSKQLLFANKCINILIKFKDCLQQMSEKFESLLEDNYKQELRDLEKDYNELNKLKDLSINVNNVKVEDNVNKHVVIQVIHEKPIKTEVLIESNWETIKPNPQTIGSIKPNPQTIESINSKLCPNVSAIKSRPHLKTDNKNSKKSSKIAKRSKTKKSYHNPNRFKCDYENCLFTAGVQRLINDHKNAIHTGERPYICSEVDCGKAYASLSYLNKHKLDVHSNRRFKCEWNGCGVEVKSRKSLKVHMRRHTGERTFDCDFPGCTFRGTNIFSITDHKNKHTGEKPYKCKFDDCTATFPYRCSLYKHYNMSHTDLRPFACDWPGCESAFKYNQALNLHKNIHTGEKSVKCDWPGCEFKCSNTTILRSHKIVHTREKKYSCSWPGCDVKYARLKGLKIHLMKHRGEKPNECETCGKRFRQKDNLKRHYQIHVRDSKIKDLRALVE